MRAITNYVAKKAWETWKRNAPKDRYTWDEFVELTGARDLVWLHNPTNQILPDHQARRLEMLASPNGDAYCKALLIKHNIK